MKTLTVKNLQCFQQDAGGTLMWVITTKEPILCAQGRTIGEAFAAFGKALQTHVYLKENNRHED